jgi:hypothetical protein
MDTKFLYIILLLLIPIVWKVTVLSKNNFKLYRREKGGVWFKIRRPDKEPVWSQTKKEATPPNKITEEEIYYED